MVAGRNRVPRPAAGITALRTARSVMSRRLSTPRPVGSAPAGCRVVAMALPTRSFKVRLLWAGLALILLFVAALALSLDGTNPAVFAVDALVVFWGFVSGAADVVRVLLTAVGPALLVALAVGALLDLIIAAVYLSVSRRRAREA